MPRYEVTVRAHGLLLPMHDSLAVGFYKVVPVRALDPVEAEVRAIEVVRRDWSATRYAFRNRGNPPMLTIERVGLLTWWHRLLGAPKGYVFFDAHGVQTALHAD
ncbi:MAG: hypothetical protein JSR36_08150 [Proteobacteria bacterium]|nr:hypothetical protein [Pseudomonadota bacterium]